LQVNLPIPESWQLVNYTPTGGATNGYVNGTGPQLPKQKAMFFNFGGTNNTTLTSLAIGFGEASTSIPDRIVPIRIFDASGIAGTPGNLLGVVNLTMADIIEDVNADQLTFIDLPQSITLPANKSIFISVDLTNLTWDNFGLKDVLAVLSNVIGQSNSTPIWDQASDNVWRRYGSQGTWNLPNTSLLIHPFVTPNPAKPTILTKNPAICSGSSFEFNGTGSTFGDILQWQLPGASAPNVFNNQFKASGQYSSSGTFKAYLLARGGCQEIRVDSTVITVNQSPLISVSTTKNPICVGESSTLVASGASNYTWIPNSAINTVSGPTVTVNPISTITYTVSGTQNGCTSLADVEIEVRSSNTNVSITASQTTITVPTSITFTAAGINAGAQPIYNFLVNDISRQSSNNNTFIQLVNPSDRVKCELTSSEPCVVEKTVTSNVILMSEITVPITLFRFTGQKAANGNQLNWITSAESNSEKFIVERSYDGNNFQAIGEVKAAGNSATSRNYAYLDGRYTEGKNFYRLRMMDKDGTFSYSNIVLIDANKSIFITSIYPNPTTSGNNALLVITDGQRGFAHITVSNMAGQVINSYKINNTTGNVLLELPSRNLPGGNYLITYRNSTGKVMETIRWTISR
jgi:hypothetical protein